MTVTNGGNGIKARRGRMARLLAVSALALAAACASPEEKVQRYSQEGAEFLEAGDLPKAYIQFRNALKINEEHVPSLIGLSEIAEQRKDYQAMFQMLQNIVRLDPSQIESHVKLGKLYLVGSDETAALESAENALEINADDPDARALKAAVLLKIGDNAGAVEIARGVVASDPANPEAVTVLATDKFQNGDRNGALEEINKALEVDPQIAVLQLLRIQILQTLGRNDETLEAYAGLIELFPEEPAYRRVYAGELVKRNEMELAREQFRAIVDLEPENLNAKLNVVRLANRVQGTAAAEAQLQEFIDANPDNDDLKFAMVDFLIEEDEPGRARALLDQLADGDDQDVALKAKNKISVLLLGEGDRESAIALIDEILEVDERNTDALMKRAALQIDDEEFDQAIVNLRTALDNSPDEYDAMVLMATAFEKQENFSFAQAEFAKAYESSDRQARIAQQFSRFLLRRRNTERAEEVLVDSLAAHPGHLENLRLLATIRLARQDWRGAEEVAGMIEQIETQDELAANVKSAAYFGLGDYDSVIETLTARDEVAPLESRPLSSLVTAYLRTDRLDEAQALLDRMLGADPDNYQARIMMARVHAAREDRESYEASLEEAVSRSPEQPEAYELLYRHYLGQGRVDDAAALIDRGIEAAPDNYAMRVFKADVLLNRGERQDALAIYSDLIEERPQDRIIANNFVSLSSDLRLDQDSIARALEIAKTIEDLENPFYRDTVGWAYYRAGDYDRAVEYLSLAVEEIEESAEMRYHLGAAQFASGDEDAARTNLEQALRLGGADFIFRNEVQALLDRM
ncbi:tetratricopeptide repeat protein [Hyphococcus flavus]|uniref:Tetratricopeptide repeat protein n=1 Tax=Hyphococcus flavus TaxID=1866326 RepID=A0AAE9ZG31_9PROT|nr:tetratricopeptide repeat protein [Hyphococcus flavus]WDI32102.1 tetratricopeptide repeat protein [Hyphococcus flavus]